MEIETISFSSHGDSRGQLIAIEQNRDIPFEIKRVYYMYETTAGVRRGFHAHKKLQQILICTSGKCKVLLDDGTEKKVVALEKPNIGLLVSGCVWREMFDFSRDAVLMVLASDYYDESDYIRNYDDFMGYLEKTKERHA